MQKPRQNKLQIVVLKRVQRLARGRNIGCTCGKVYRNPDYTFQYATCPLHSPRTVDAC